MGLTNISTSTPIVYTTAQLQTRLAGRIRNANTVLLQQMVLTFSTLMGLIWANPDQLTPQEAFDSMGTDAGNLVVKANLLKDIVNATVPGTIPDATLPTLTTNSDGTVTVGT